LSSPTEQQHIDIFADEERRLRKTCHGRLEKRKLTAIYGAAKFGQIGHKATPPRDK
jgi:hypothetical protein